MLVSILALAQRASTASHHVWTSTHGFNSRPRTEGILSSSFLSAPFQKFQFSPSHRGHPSEIKKISKAMTVSIRALAQRASIHIMDDRQGLDVSILALAQRASIVRLCARIY